MGWLIGKPVCHGALISNTSLRDIARMNVMMDADALFPLGWHPITHGYLPEGNAILAPVNSRMDHPVKYYYIDFGISVRFLPGDYPKTVTGTAARVREIPELSWDVPYDPFKVDIFSIGNLCHRVTDVPAEIAGCLSSRAFVWFLCSC